MSSSGSLGGLSSSSGLGGLPAVSSSTSWRFRPTTEGRFDDRLTTLLERNRNMEELSLEKQMREEKRYEREQGARSKERGTTIEGEGGRMGGDE